MWNLNNDTEASFNIEMGLNVLNAEIWERITPDKVECPRVANPLPVHQRSLFSYVTFHPVILIFEFEGGAAHAKIK